MTDESTGEEVPASRPGLLRRTKRFLLHDLWSVEPSSLTGLQGVAVRFLRIVHLLIKGISEDNLLLHASSLTFSTLMAIVPLLTIGLAMSRGLGAGDQLINSLLEFSDSMPEQFQSFVQGILTQVQSTNFLAVSGISGLVLLVMVLQVLNSIEGSFNQIWGIRTSRSFLRKSAYYISTIVVVPILFFASGTLTAGFEPMIERLGGAGVYALLLKVAPVVTTWLAFSFLYAYLPNTQVRARTAFAGGLVGALLWLGWLRFYVTVQPGVGNYNLIYGALASIPIFLAWLFMSWVIVLLGARLSFAIQNDATYHLERVATRASVEAKLLLALAVTTRAAEAFDGQAGTFEAGTFAKNRGVSIRLVYDVLGLLVRHGLMAEVAEGEGRYLLMRSPTAIPVREIIRIIMEDGARPVELGLNHLRQEIKSLLVTMEQGIDRTIENMTIHDLLPKAP